MILFLDFDGVLHPELCIGPGQFVHLRRFERWLRTHAEIEVVISSSWRNQVPWLEIVDRFSADIQTRIVGRTPSRLQIVSSLVPAEVLIYKREAEIFEWRCTQGRLSDPWVAVDDMPSLFSDGCANLMLIDPATGITEGDLAALSKRVDDIIEGRKT